MGVPSRDAQRAEPGDFRGKQLVFDLVAEQHPTRLQFAPERPGFRFVVELRHRL